MFRIHSVPTDAEDPVFAMHRGGKISVRPTVDVTDRHGLAMAYTPGVARVCTAIAEAPELAADYTWVSNTVAVVTDGTAVLGLGDIGPAAAMPVMEGKSLLFKRFADVDAVPICLACTGIDEIVATVAALAPSFGGINLEDISAPRCFEIEDRLQADARHPGLPRRPARHGDRDAGRAAQRGAGGRQGVRPAPRRRGGRRSLRCGGHEDAAARPGSATSPSSDSKGLIYQGRDGLNPVKAALAAQTNKAGLTGSTESALRGADVFIGLSSGTVAESAIASMADGRDRLRPVQPRPRGPPGRGGPARPGRRHRPQRLPEPDQQLAGLPRRVPRRPGHARQRHHRRP